MVSKVGSLQLLLSTLLSLLLSSYDSDRIADSHLFISRSDLFQVHLILVSKP
jgi:hypothetical protein